MGAKHSFSWFGGIDENGLGPRLGPLVVTGVLAKATTDEAKKHVIGPPSTELNALIGDSKRLVGFGHSTLGEAWVRAILHRQGLTPKSPDDAIRLLAIDPSTQWPVDCPPTAFPLCRTPLSPELDQFQATEVVLQRIQNALTTLEEQGIQLVMAKSIIVCPRHLNRARECGVSRLDVDLHAMEQLFRHFCQSGNDGLLVHCGKVGGLTFYTSHFSLFRPDILGILHESKELSAYQSGNTQIQFVLDAEPKHQLVALASLIGKWVRDVLMNRLLEHLRVGHPEWPTASGYNDKNTKALIELSEDKRRKLGIPDDCFRRK